MEIRQMTASDYEKVYAMWLTCKGMLLTDVDDSKEGITAFLEKNPTTCFVAEDNGEIIGSVLGGSDGRRGYIYHASVRPDRRREGIGKMLIDRALEAFKGVGIKMAALLVYRGNDAGNALWDCEGFSRKDDILYRTKELCKIVKIRT